MFNNINLFSKNSNIYYEQLVNDILKKNFIDIIIYKKWKNYIKKYVDYFFKTKVILKYVNIPSITV